MNGDLISRKALIREVNRVFCIRSYHKERIIDLIDNAPTVEPFERIGSICEVNCGYNPQGKCENCKHFKESLCENSPDGWCLIRRVTQEGNLETQVPKDYYCSWYEKGGAE